MLERTSFHVVGFFVLTDISAAQHVPAMIGGYFVEPRGKGPSGVVLVQLISNLHENFHGCVFGVFAGRKRSAAETENGRSVFPVQVAPSLGVASPGPGNDCARFLCFGIHPVWHPAWFLDV